ncbi:MAG: efflux RND transporter periplasmic adaptor subunit [Sulfuricellaceae bacterium]
MKLLAGQRRWAVALSLALIPCLAWSGDEIRITPEQAKQLGIQTQGFSTQAGAGGIAFPAQVIVPNGQLQVVSVPVAALVESLLVAVNQPVKKGQALARLQSPAIVEAQREFLNAATQSGLAGQSLKRDAQLYQEGIIAEGRYLNTRGAAVQAGAAYNQWRQTLKLYGMSDGAIRKLQATGQLSGSLELASPIDGVVIEQSVVAGQRAEASVPLYKVAKLSPLWLEIEAVPASVAGVAAGSAVTIPAYGASGKVLSVGRSVNAASQTVTVRAEITQGTESLRAGQYVDALIAAAPASVKQWRVPTAALVRNQGKAYLFIQGKAGFVPTEVKVLGEVADSAVVQGSLRGTERYAVRGVSALKASWMGLGGGE